MHADGAHMYNMAYISFTFIKNLSPSISCEEQTNIDCWLNETSNLPRSITEESLRILQSRFTFKNTLGYNLSSLDLFTCTFIQRTDRNFTRRKKNYSIKQHLSGRGKLELEQKQVSSACQIQTVAVEVFCFQVQYPLNWIS